MFKFVLFCFWYILMCFAYTCVCICLYTPEEPHLDFFLGMYPRNFPSGCMIPHSRCGLAVDNIGWLRGIMLEGWNIASIPNHTKRTYENKLSLYILTYLLTYLPTYLLTYRRSQPERHCRLSLYIFFVCFIFSTC